jgi:2-C-methyl-D-erythritol 2,4-cyclodiphosphate synthase
MIRVGLGFDSHRLVPGRKLLLGGVDVPSPFGEKAHSDGDVLLHALCDAIYGACGRGDIGEHFPDTDARWKDRPSSHFLLEAARLAKSDGWRLVNVDATILLETPKLSPWKKAIAQNIRGILSPLWHLEENAVSIKAKTMERCDAVGRSEAIVAHVAVLLESGGS